MYNSSKIAQYQYLDGVELKEVKQYMYINAYIYA